MLQILAISGYLFYGGLNAADLASTQYALARPNVVEANPVMRGHLARQLAVKAGATYGMGKLESKIAPKWRWVPRVIVGAGYGFVVYRNMELGRRKR